MLRYVYDLPAISQALPKVTGHMPTTQQAKGVAKLPVFGPERPSPASLQRSDTSPPWAPNGLWAAAGNSTRNKTRTATFLQPSRQAYRIHVIYILVHTIRIPPAWAARPKARRKCAPVCLSEWFCNHRVSAGASSARLRELTTAILPS